MIQNAKWRQHGYHTWLVHYFKFYSYQLICDVSIHENCEAMHPYDNMLQYTYVNSFAKRNNPLTFTTNTYLTRTNYEDVTEIVKN